MEKVFALFFGKLAGMTIPKLQEKSSIDQTLPRSREEHAKPHIRVPSQNASKEPPFVSETAQIASSSTKHTVLHHHADITLLCLTSLSIAATRSSISLLRALSSSVPCITRKYLFPNSSASSNLSAFQYASHA